jgi:tripartite-type tricarboxylate transporter receptor subunit TctC
MKLDRRQAVSALALAGFAPLNRAFAQQGYPSGTVTIELPLAPGTGGDALVRIYADALQTALGKPVITKNAPGAALMIPAIDISKAAPDGLTLMMTVSSTLCINPTLYKTMPYDADKDFAPIALYVKSPFILVVGADSPIKTAKDLVRIAKESPGKLNFASLGVGAMQHLSMELVMDKFGLKLNHVPYRATPQQMTDIASGNVDIGFVEAAAPQGLIKDGKLRALAVTSSSRFAIYPDVPTLEQAFDSPGMEAVSWHVMMAPVATPAPNIDRLHQEMKKITGDAAFKARASDLGLLPIDTPEIDGIKAFIKKEQATWGALIKKIGIAGTQ